MSSDIFTKLIVSQKLVKIKSYDAQNNPLKKELV